MDPDPVLNLDTEVQNATFIKKLKTLEKGAKSVFRIHNPDEKYILAAG
jgi:hypothetical protein